MKKFFVSLVMLLSTSAACVFAQSSLIATLSHEGEITPFYGANALKEAHAAAVHGDAITLSSGTFNATDITKAITLRGAGMQVDTVNNVLPTIISGDFSIQIAGTVTKKLTIEGIYHNHHITVKGTLMGARFIKNRFSIFNSEVSTKILNSTFLHCKVVDRIYFTRYSDATLNNCYIRIKNTIALLQLSNSIVGAHSQSGLAFLENVALSNCLLIGNGDYDYLPSSSVAYNCVAIDCYGNDCFKNISNTTNVHSTYSAVFKDFTGTYYDNITFGLTEEAKNKFLGTDDTQVGIYGGNFPFDPTTSNPHITKCNVAAKSTADGKLSVDVEVAGVE